MAGASASRQRAPKIGELARLPAGDLIDGYRKARTVHLGEHRPASTLVIARRLAQPGWLVEIEAIAAKA